MLYFICGTIVGFLWRQSMEELILIVDDDKQMLKTLRGYLIDEYNVAPVSSGKVAIDFLTKRKPDLILLDYSMPLFDGPAVFNMVRKKEETRDIPIIFLTGITDKEKIIDVLALKPDGYIVKPVSKEELLRRIGEVMSKSR